jgi:lipopolysaccharide export system permease protein
VYAIRALELKQAQMMDLMLEREGSTADYPTIILAAERANYREPGRLRKGVKPSRWTLHRGTIRYLAGTEPTGEYSFEFDTLHSRTLNERPVDLLAEPKAPDEMRYGELRSYIDALTRSGSNAKKLQVELALKIAIPFISLLIALFGAPLAISSPKSGMAWGVAASLATTFIVLLMFQLAKAVGAGGVLPPDLAAWMPNILVGAAAFYLLKKAPT